MAAHGISKCRFSSMREITTPETFTSQVEQQSALIRRAEQQLAEVEAERRTLAARAAELSVNEADFRQRTAALERRDAELAGEASR